MNSVTHSAEQRKFLFIENSRKIHGDKYDYSRVIYTTARDKVEIVCPIHGPFFQIPDSHSSGRGCRKCGFEKSVPAEQSKRKSQEEFLNECRAVHGDKYDYSKVVYTGKVNNIEVICPIHGSFLQKAENHRNGSGCKECGVKKAHNYFLQSTEDFIRKSKEVHGDKYDYSISEYRGKSKPISIICKIHGVFSHKAAQHHYMKTGLGCPKCVSSGVSSQELELIEYISSLGVETDLRNRSIIAPQELDIVIPSKNIAIEYNGLFWHSEENGKDKSYHLNKTLDAKKRGYRLIHIFEDEWVLKKEIVKSRIAHILGKSSEVRYARKLSISIPSKKEVFNFSEKTHIQGACMYSTAFGLFDGETLVACMTFGRNRFTKDGSIELLRYSTLGNVVGGFSRLLKEFFRQFPEVKSITSYSDRRWSEGNVYEKNGFTHVGSSSPSYFYIPKNKTERIHRMGFQKHKLPGVLPIFDESLSEVENMRANGYSRIFDCGTDKWELII